MIEPWQPTGRPSKPAPQPTARHLELRQRHAVKLCKNAANLTSWLLADKLARLWDCDGCKALGIEQPE